MSGKPQFLSCFQHTESVERRRPEHIKLPGIARLNLLEGGGSLFIENLDLYGRMQRLICVYKRLIKFRWVGCENSKTAGLSIPGTGGN
jgi:hypothetical protein